MLKYNEGIEIARKKLYSFTCLVLASISSLASALE